MSEPLGYSGKVAEHVEHPRNVGAFDRADPAVGTGLVGAPASGGVMKLQIKVDARDRRHRRRPFPQDLRLRLDDRVEFARQ